MSKRKETFERTRGQIYSPNIKKNLKLLKHKDSFGKSENLSKIFCAEILVFDHLIILV